MQTVLFYQHNKCTGELFNVRWTTRNIGVGVTNVNNWVDRVYLSQDVSLGEL